jgi:hypothetical protein
MPDTTTPASRGGEGGAKTGRHSSWCEVSLGGFYIMSRTLLHYVTWELVDIIILLPFFYRRGIGFGNIVPYLTNYLTDFKGF